MGVCTYGWTDIEASFIRSTWRSRVSLTKDSGDGNGGGGMVVAVVTIKQQ